MTRQKWATLARAAFAAGALAIGSDATARAVDTPLAISTSTIDFGDVNLGNSSSVPVLITNTDVNPIGPLTIAGGGLSGTFSNSQNCQGATLPAGGSCTVTFQFTPPSVGTFDGASNFTVGPTGSPGEGFSVTLTGNGVIPLIAAPLSIDFGNVTVGTTSATIATMITNTSADPFGPVTISGGGLGGDPFGNSQNCQGATLAAGGSCSVFYTFSPVSTGIFALTNIFFLSATAAPGSQQQVSVDLVGCGVQSGQPCPPPATTLTVVNCTPNPSVAGSTVTCIASVTGGSSPTGSLTFIVDGSASAPLVLAAGQASFSTGGLSLGTHLIGASFTPDSPNYLASTSASFTEVIIELAIPALAPLSLVLLGLMVAGAGLIAFRRGAARDA